MKKRTLSLLLAGVLALSTLDGCGGDEKTPAEEAGTLPDLTGVWTDISDADESGEIQATITDDTIEVMFDMHDLGEYLYWAGTFEAPTDADEPYTWTSVADQDALSTAILGSVDAEKVFTYKDGQISFDMTVDGETCTIYMEKTHLKADNKTSASSSAKVDKETPAGNSAGTLDDFYVEIGDCSFGEDYEGNKVIVIDYTFTNNSDETTSASVELSFKAFQDGVELEMAFSDDVDYGIGQKDIRPGVTLENCQEGFVLTSDSTVEVEASYWLDDSGAYLYKTFEVKQ